MTQQTHINAISALENSQYAGYSAASDNHTWTQSGVGMQVTPDTNDRWEYRTWEELNGTAPCLQFKFKVETPGAYYVYVNMSNPDNGADSYYIAMDGRYEYIGATGEQLGDTKWFGEKRPIELSAGEHTLTVFAREDGLTINQILITQNAEFTHANELLSDISPREGDNKPVKPTVKSKKGQFTGQIYINEQHHAVIGTGANRGIILTYPHEFGADGICVCGYEKPDNGNDKANDADEIVIEE